MLFLYCCILIILWSPVIVGNRHQPKSSLLAAGDSVSTTTSNDCEKSGSHPGHPRSSGSFITRTSGLPSLISINIHSAKQQKLGILLDDVKCVASNNNLNHNLNNNQFNSPASPNQQQINPLLKQATTASIGVLFGILIWRSLTAYEYADQFSVGILRLFAVSPVVLILLANILGFLLNIAKPLNFKVHLKLILAMNIIREWVELCYNVYKIVFTNSKAIIPREVYFGRFFMNVWWSLLCFSFARSRWVLNPNVPTAPASRGSNNQNYHSKYKY